LEQKLIELPLCENVQHKLFELSVQSALAAQRRKISVPEQVVPVVVGQAALVAHATTGGSVVQFGTLPPVTVMFAQQTGAPLLHPAGDMHTNPPSVVDDVSPDEALSLPPLSAPVAASTPPPPVSEELAPSWPPPAESAAVDASSPPPPAVESSPPHAASA